MSKRIINWKKVRKEVIDKLYGIQTDDGSYEYQGVCVDSETLEFHNCDDNGVMKYYQFYSTFKNLNKHIVYGAGLFIPKEIIDNEELSIVPVSHFELQAINNGVFLLKKRSIGDVVLHEI